MKTGRSQSRYKQLARTLCLLLLALPSTQAQTTETNLNSRKVEIQALIDDGIYTEAIRKLESYLEERPGDTLARRQIAKAYLELEDYFRLRYHTRILLQNLPEDPQALAWNKIAEGVIAEKYPIMVKDLLTSLEKEPENSVLRRELISLYVSGGESDKAAEQFRYLLDQQPDDEVLWLNYARNLSWMNELDKSLAAYAKYIEIAKEPRDVRMEVARVHAWNEQYGTAVNQLRVLIEEIPGNHDARALLADIFRWNDDSMAASDIYEGILEEDPENASALRGMEELAKMQERRADTTATMNIEKMELRVKETPEDTDALLQLARLYGAANRYVDAAKAFASYLVANPDDLPVRREYAFALSIEEEYDEAIHQLRLYLENYPDDMPTHMRIVRMQMWKGANELAKRELLELQKIVPKNAELQWSLGRIYEMEENWPQAIYHYEELRRNAPHFEVATAKIREIETNPRYQMAQLEQRIEKDPTDFAARLQLARTFLDLDRFYEAKQQAEAVISYQPEHEQAQRIVGWADLGITKARRIRLEEVREILVNNPEDSTAILEMARLLKDENDYPEALRYYFKYLSAFPEDLKARLEYAQVLSWEPNQLDSALTEYAILVQNNPEDLDLKLTYYELVSRANSLTEDDLVDLATIEDIFRNRVYANDQDAEALYFLGRLYQLDSDWSAALDFYDSALAANEGNPQRNTLIQQRIDAILELPDFKLAQLTQRVEGSPTNTELRLVLARRLFDLKRYYEAREQANEVLTYAPENAEANRIIGWSDIGLEEVRFERIRSMRGRLRENSEDYEAALTLARLLKEEQIYPESLRYYFYYLSAYPDDYEVRKEYANVLSWEPTQLQNAVREFGTLAEMRPRDIELQLQYYELLARLSELDTRAKSYLSAIEDELRERLYFNQTDDEALYYVGRLHQIDGNWNSALDYYEAALAAGSNDTAVQDRIDSILATPDFQIAVLESRVASDPANLELRMSLVRLLFENERYYKAREQADQVRSLAGNHSEARQIALYSAKWIDGQRAEELQNLRLRVSQNPRDLEAQLALARILRNQEAFGEARQRYRLYLRAYPEDFDVRREYAETLAWSGENTDEAIREYRELLFLYPNDPELKLQFARMLTWNPKNWNEAEEVLDDLNMYESEDPEVIILQADIKRYQGHYAEARRLYDRVMELSSSSQGYNYADERFVPVQRYAPEDRFAPDTNYNPRLYRDADENENNIYRRDLFRGNFRETNQPTYQNFRSEVETNNESQFQHQYLLPATEVQPTTAKTTAETDTTSDWYYPKAEDYTIQRAAIPLDHADEPVAVRREYSEANAFRPTQPLNTREQFTSAEAATERSEPTPRPFRSNDTTVLRDDTIVRSDTSLRTYTIPGDPEPTQAPVVRPQARIEEPRPPVYRDPGYVNVPDYGRQRDTRFVSGPDRYINTTAQRLDDRRIYRQAEPRSYPVETAQPRTRAVEARVYTREFDPLPEPPRYYTNSRNRLAEPIFEEAFTDSSIRRSRERSSLNLGRIPETTRYDYSRQSLEPDPVRYVRQQVTTRRSEDPYMDYRSTLPPPTRYDARYDSYREPRYESYREPRYETYREPRYETYREPRYETYREPRYETYREPRYETYREPRETFREPAFETYREPRETYREPRYESSSEPRIQTDTRPRYETPFPETDSIRYNNIPDSFDRTRNTDWERGVENNDERGRKVPPTNDNARPYYYNSTDETFLNTQYAYTEASIPESARYELPSRTYVEPSNSAVAIAPTQPSNSAVAIAPTQPLRFEGRSTVINPLPYEQGSRTYLPPEARPVSQPPRLAPYQRQADPRLRELLNQSRAIAPSTTSTFAGTTRQLGDSSLISARLPYRYAERIQSVSNNELTFSGNAYDRAREGKSAIANQLRPEIMFDFGYETDSDGFNSSHIGGRFNYFTENGTLYHIGLAFDQFSEDNLVPFETVDAQSITFGASGFMNAKVSGFAEIMLTNFSQGPGTTVSGSVGGSFNLDGINTITAQYSHFDFVREAKTVRSLREEITADRLRVDWTSNPTEPVEGKSFGERLFFEGSGSVTSLSDGNSSISYLLRPYYRIADNPNIDVSFGWQGLSYTEVSTFYWSPDFYQGPFIGGRISGQTFWELIYDIRANVNFPTQAQASRSLSFSLRKNFTNHFNAGVNVFLTDSPRTDDQDYRFAALLFDLSYRF